MSSLDPAGLNAASTANLRRLFVLRNVAIAALVAAILITVHYLHIALPTTALALVIGALVLFNVLTRVRLRWRTNVSHQEFFLQLLVDIVAFTAVLYLTGGGSNPFVALYLLPLTIAATVLPGRYTWWVAGFTVLCYSALFVQHVPLEHAHQHDDFSLHVFGMWLAFVLSAALIAYFVVGMGNTLRSQETALAAAREQALRDQQLIALGTLAASTAHDLGTPLATMSLLAEEIEDELEQAEADAVAEKVVTLRAQLVRCKEVLATLSASAGSVQLSGGRRLSVDAYLDNLLAQWREQRPDVHLHCHCAGPQPAPAILADQTLSQALINVLDNAADVSPDDVECEISWSAGGLQMEVLDRGPGLDGATRANLGQPGFSTKPHGMGLGLFLTHAIIERFGGRVQLRNRDGGGVRTQITLPFTFEQESVLA